jgi:DUF1680 family protein
MIIGHCKATILVASIALFSLSAGPLIAEEASVQPVRKTVLPLHGLMEIEHSQVQLRGGFWGPRIKRNCEVTVPHALDCLERNGHITNFDKAAGKFDGPLRGHHAFDSDLHKTMEGAMVTLQHCEDRGLQERAESILDRIIAAQQKDGYLISYFIVKGLEKKWDDLRLEHQMYNAGHFFEMAIEHQRLTGGTKAIDAARRFADHMDATFGPEKIYDVDGHEEVELALVKLYRATGERRYLDLARFFLDERGHLHGTKRESFTPGPLVAPTRVEGQTNEEYNRAVMLNRLRWRNGRMQDHKPLVEQDEAVGHAVRAGYVYAAMADIARFSDAPEYKNAVDRLWQDVISRKIYVNGGIGTAQYGDEGFGDPYLLPNRTYCESCSGIANVFWQHRMALLKADAKYADVMEVVLYNSAISGISLSGDAFFYQNPLESNGGERSSWIGLACCPTNLTRIIPQVGGFVYAQGDRQLYVNLYVAGEASITWDTGSKVQIRQETNYPWDGQIKLTVSPEKATQFDLCLRMPGWARGHPLPSDLYVFADAARVSEGAILKVNGKVVDIKPKEDGYLHVDRTWLAGDSVELSLPMEAHRVYAHKNVLGNRSKLSFMRGPVTYCLEAIDNPNIDLFKVTVPTDARLDAEYRGDLLGGVTVIRTTGIDDQHRKVSLTAVPYYAWANREKGPMAIWINELPPNQTP